MTPDVTRVTSSPLKDWGDDTLKRRFSNLYADIHVNGIQDGVHPRATLYAMQEELVERGIDPADVIGPKVI